jgi:predicted HTH domain antitoxin
MTIELPDIEAVEKLSPSELRLELACALYDRGRITKITGAELAGVDFFEFQRALGERRIATVTEEMFESDLATLKALFPK